MPPPQSVEPATMQDGVESMDGNRATSPSQILAPSRSGAQNQDEDTTSGKFTLTIDCTALLKPNPDRPGMFMPRTVDESVERFCLHSVVQLPIIDQTKVKMYHTCGLVEFEDAICMHALWDMGDWVVAQYQNRGRRVDVDKKGDGRGRDWAEPDAYFVVTVD